MDPQAEPKAPVNRRFIDTLLQEDLGSGDLTASILDPAHRAKALVRTREAMVLCGQDWFDAVFERLDPQVQIQWHVLEGAFVPEDTLLCQLEGPARALLSGERSALNLLQTLSGTATLARQYAQAVSGTPLKILDTRKTLPGLRMAQKYAVRVGGCHNHRIGLFDGILIKENHILALGSITQALEAAREINPGVLLEVEVENLRELQEALDAGATRIMLDEFSEAEIKEAVALTRGRAELEVSGNVQLEDLQRLARLGVDFVSIGALTKNVKAIDLSMRITLEPS